MFLADLPFVGGWHARARSCNRQDRCSGRSTPHDSSAFFIKTGLKVNLNQLIDLRCFIIKTELKVNLNKLIDLVLIKTTVAALEIESLLGTPLSQRGAVMRATMSFLFAQSKKLVVAVIP
jgi:hypothetical protein